MILATVLMSIVGVAPGDPAADAITLRDGQVILGQIVEPAPRDNRVYKL